MPRPVDCDRPLASSVTLERVQPDAFKWADVIKSFGRVQDCQQQRNALPNQRSTGSMICPRSFNGIATQPDHWCRA